MWLVSMLIGCGARCGPTVGMAITACTMDAGGPATADAVVWSWPLDSEDYDGEHPLTCADPECTVWVLEGELQGEVLVAAGRGSSVETDGACPWHEYDDEVVSTRTDWHRQVTLTLDDAAVCD